MPQAGRAQALARKQAVGNECAIQSVDVFKKQAGFNGCGLLILNAPFGFEEAGADILAALLERLGDGEPGAGTRILRVADE